MTWALIGKAAVSLLIAVIFGYIGAIACMDDDSWNPNGIFRAVMWTIGVLLIVLVWTVWS